jgi:hypothetical protein
VKHLVSNPQHIINANSWEQSGFSTWGANGQVLSLQDIHGPIHIKGSIFSTFYSPYYQSNLYGANAAHGCGNYFQPYGGYISANIKTDQRVNERVQTVATGPYNIYLDKHLRTEMENNDHLISTAIFIKNLRHELVLH